MIHGSIQARRNKFIKEMIDYGSQSVADMIRAYKSSYPQCKKDETARVAGYRLLHDNTIVQAIDKGLREKEEAFKRAQQKEIERQAKEKVVTEIQIDAILSAIVEGKKIKKKSYVTYDKEIKQFKRFIEDVEPDESAIVAAANLLYKRKGSFAAEKVTHEAGDSFIEMMKVLSQKKKNKEDNV
jgi:hypothetical protein